MTIAREIKKLFNLDAWSRLMASIKRAPYKVSTHGWVKSLDAGRLAEIRRKHYQPGENPSKYLDIDWWMEVNAKRLADIPVIKAPPRLRILDIGCGAGYFIYIAQQLGHEALGTDIKGPEFYDDMINLLQVPRILHRVQAFKALPDEMRSYDVIAAHMTCFNRRPDKSHWGVEEWAFFMEDVKSRLNPGGTIQFHLNRLDDGRPMESDVKTFFLKTGCRVDRSRVVFRAKKSR